MQYTKVQLLNHNSTAVISTLRKLLYRLAPLSWMTMMQWCFYHLMQSMWKKVQELVWSAVSPFHPLMIWLMTWQYLKVCHVDLLNYTDTASITGTDCTPKAPSADNGDIPAVAMWCLPIQFPPHLLMLNDRTHTSDICQSRNVTLCTSQTRTHSSTLPSSTSCSKDNAIFKTDRVKRTSQELQTMLHQAIADWRNGVSDFLHSVAHNIQFI